LKSKEIREIHFEIRREEQNIISSERKIMLLRERLRIEEKKVPYRGMREQGGTVIVRKKDG
jgi:hypothetical protein